MLKSKYPMSFSDSFFAADSASPRRDLENYLSEALSRGGDYADLYFEYLATSSISIDESIVKSANAGRFARRRACGSLRASAPAMPIRDDLSPEKISTPRRWRRMIAAGPAKVEKTPLEEGRSAIFIRC